MPIYQYKCPNCGTVFDIFHRNGNTEEPVCSECGIIGERILSPVYSNFTSWSDTLNSIGKWSTKHEDFSATADGR